MAQDPYRYFRIEAQELTESLIRDLMTLESGPVQSEIVARLMRSAHTLKGAAGVVKQTEIVKLAHAIEDALAPLRSGETALPDGMIDGFLAQLDAMTAFVASLGQTAPPPETTAPPTAGAAVPDEPEALLTVRTDVREMDAVLAGLAECGGSIGALKRGVAAVSKAKAMAADLADHLTSEAGVANAQERRVRGLQVMLDDLQQGLATAIEHTERHLLQLRGRVEDLRLVPVADLSAILERSAREAARALGKAVVMETAGTDVRLDAQVLTALQGALVQAVRNAVAHGIESSAEREMAGKPPVGRIRLDVSRHGARIVFRCADDGRGVDQEAVRRVAIAQGLLDPDAEVTAADLLPILMSSGFSTSEQVTPVAGRGVGLDVVRSAVTRLGGEMALYATPGQGTTLEMSVPALVTSLQALIVEAAGITAAIPLHAVPYTVRLQAEQLCELATGTVVVLGSDSLPFLPLARALGQAAPSHQQAWSAAIIEAGGRRVVIGLDRLVGSAVVTVRPLPALAAAEPIVLGTSADAEGLPQLVLDPVALVACATTGASAGELRPRALSVPERLPILVIDDSLTTRMLLESILEVAGYSVDVAASGDEALRKVRQRRFGLCLVDVEMPGMDGFTFIERLRSEPGLAAIPPAIMITSRSGPEDRRRGFAAGAADFFAKGEFDQTALLDAIRRLME